MGGCVFYGVSYVCARFASSLNISSADFGVGVAPLSALLCCFLFYSVTLAERMYSSSPSMLSRLAQTWIASLFSAVALTFSISIHLILIALVLFAAARLVFPDRLIDEEASRRKPQTLREFGLDPVGRLPLWTLLVVFMGAALVLWAWHRA
jgi:hypothetical protein